jgi:hypothetical protein
MSNLLTNNLFDVMNEVQDLQRVETPGACLTLTRSATLAITTAGTTITWQVETRANGITWATTDITIPTSGYYNISFSYTATTIHTAFCRLVVNGVSVILMTDSSINSTSHTFTAMRYFTDDDVVRIQPVPASNTTISVVAANSAGESPILHVVQMTGSLT